MPTNITFIIGNGFDLNLKLKTSYADFHKYIKDLKPDTKNGIYRDIQSNPETWSDFEKALGAYTFYLDKLPGQARELESNKIHDDLDEVILDLSEYLQSQEKKLIIDNIRFEKLDFAAELNDSQKSQIYEDISTAQLRFDFVTLNYTRVLEKLFPKNTSANTRDFGIGDIFHIHGTVTDDLTMGVSHSGQLSRSLNRDDMNALIKPNLIQMALDGRLNTLTRIINDSSIIVLFGTSIGVTDIYIWRMLVDWLRSDTENYIIIHKHNENFSEKQNLFTRRRQQSLRAIQDRLLKAYDFDEGVREALRARIFIIHNTKKLFSTPQVV